MSLYERAGSCFLLSSATSLSLKDEIIRFSYIQYKFNMLKDFGLELSKINTTVIYIPQESNKIVLWPVVTRPLQQ